MTVTAGLHYLHSAFRTPLIHRDIKATNILLSQDLDAKISDLGLARAIRSEGRTHTITGNKVGTDGYIAPEYVFIIYCIYIYIYACTMDRIPNDL